MIATGNIFSQLERLMLKRIYRLISAVKKRLDIILNSPYWCFNKCKVAGKEDLFVYIGTVKFLKHST